ncbi:TonB-dependent receptor [Asticcacaulis sp. SL142]|uniref:TonB-dependent receptor n=1 Tax=Asticcacaulis sp. SL142 TaxID=2995155 RepID=UPI00226CE451|nr:TonB-dependent receptor [Asticcacaulis sp. SL142]WAC48333.1 TonB-dependent receptor [Asticcacaulis sp. SL142]
MGDIKRKLACLWWVTVALSHPAWAQETTKPKDETPTVTIKGKKPLNRADRQVYDVTKDPDHDTATADDTLKKIPGVAVDAEGGVTIRGNQAQVMVNGRPWLMYVGDNRAAALRSMPSSMIASIEVISTPGAQYGSNGTGGIINIVTKRSLPPGWFASTTVQVSSNGAGMVNGVFQYNRDKLTASVFANIADYKSESHSAFDLAQLTPDGRPVITTDQTNRSTVKSRSNVINGSIDYQLDDNDSLSGQFSYLSSSGTDGGEGQTRRSDANGTPTDLYDSDLTSRFDNETQTLGLGWTRTGATAGDALKVDLKVNRNTSTNRGDNLSFYSLSSLPENQGPRAQNSLNRSEATTAVFSVDYNKGLESGEVTTGLQITHDDADNNNESSFLYTPGVETPALNPAFSNPFTYRQTIRAAYATWQTMLGDHWVVLGGLRAEGLSFESRNAATGAPVKVDYTNLNPSAFATYVISEHKKIRFNYSRRLQRPGAWDLNPSQRYGGAQLVSVGTPDLKPQETDSFETSYEYAKDMTSLSVRAYRLQNRKIISNVRTFIDDPQNAGNQVVLVSRRNAGRSEQTGVQFDYRSQIRPNLSFNTTLTVFEMAMTLPDMPDRSQVTVNSQIGLNYYSKKGHGISLNLNSVGKQINDYGYMVGNTSVMATYNHALSPPLTLTVMATDVLRTTKTKFVTETRDSRGLSYASRQAPVISISLSRRFGSGYGAPKSVKPK